MQILQSIPDDTGRLYFEKQINQFKNEVCEHLCNGTLILKKELL